MIFAELSYPGHYSDQHDPIVECLLPAFPDLQHGHQGDSWIWIGDGEGKISIDTFYSMTHRVMASGPDNPILEPVLEQLSSRFELKRFEPPQPEPHED